MTSVQRDGSSGGRINILYIYGTEKNVVFQFQQLFIHVVIRRNGIHKQMDGKTQKLWKNFEHQTFFEISNRIQAMNFYFDKLISFLLSLLLFF